MQPNLYSNNRPYTNCDRVHYEQTDINGSIYQRLSRNDIDTSIFVETGKTIDANSYIQLSSDGTATVQKNNRCNLYDYRNYREIKCSNLQSCQISSSYLPIYLQKQNLGLAAAHHDIDGINHIINLGIIDINKRTNSHKYGYSSGEKPTALYNALYGRGDACLYTQDGIVVRKTKFPAFKLLVDAGADINQIVYRYSPLYHAASMVKEMMDRDKGGPHQRVNATTSSEMEILKLLICKGAKSMEPINYGYEGINEAVNQLFNKYKILLIAAKDDQSSLNCFPREILSYISILSTRVTYEKETPKKKIEESSEMAEKKIEDVTEIAEKSFSLIDEVEECYAKVKESTCSIQ